MNRLVSVMTIGLLFVSAGPAVAQFQVRIDENGGGSYFGPNGELHTWGGMVTLSSPPVYHLQTALGFVPSPGDVLVSDAATAVLPGDLLRFDGNGNLTVYSDVEASDVPPFDLADVGVPTPATNLVTRLETDPTGGPAVEGQINGLFGYSPAPGTPGGYPAGTVGSITYEFVSDTPEPAALTWLGCAATALLRRSTRRALWGRSPRGTVRRDGSACLH